jgi:Zn-dependent peptidase ImmA (M78 family)
VTTNGVVGNNTHRKLNPDEFSGFVLVDDLAPFVFVNGADWKAAQMFTLAHELAHVWFGQSAVFDLHELQAPAEDVERACDHVAAELLVPEVALRELWPTARRGAEPFQVVARHFKVSSLVAARRALDLTLVTRDQFFEFYRAYEQDERRRSAAAVAAGRSGGDFYLTQNVRLGRRFAYAVAHAVREGRLLYRDAYHLVGFAGGTFDRFITEISASRRGVM